MMRSSARRTLGVVTALFLASCFGDSTGLRESRRAPLAFAPVFDRQALLLVDFTRVHITLVRPGTTPPEVALDTTVDFPSDQDSLRLPLTVSLSAGATSEPFDLTLAMLDSAGAVVFRGGPTRVTATAGVLGGQAPGVPMVYVGTGSTAAGVRFRAPVPTTVFFDSTAVFEAEAYDSAGAAIAGAPILFSVASADTAKARVPDPRVGHVVAKSVRGPARVIAELLTHQTDTATLYVQPRPSAIAVRSGAGQTATAGTALAQPLVVRVTAADGLGVEGVPVTFKVTSGGGSVSQTIYDTDVNGDATANWTLGSLVGTQTLTASVGAVSSGPIGATATATPVASVTVSPATATLTVGATQQLAATTRDSAGATLMGRVVTWASSASGVAMVSSGGLVTAVAAGSATITATSEGVIGTATVTVTSGAVSTAQSTVSVSAGTVAAGGTVTLTLQAKDAGGTNLTSGGLTVVFSASGGTSTGTIGATTDSANGRYTATFTAVTAGTATTVQATIGGVAVTSTLPTVTVTSAVPTTGTLQVTVTGLTGSPANGGSAVAQRTDSAGTPIAINISAAGSGSSANVPAGTYTVTYAAPSGFAIAGGVTNPVTGLVVISGGTATATFAVQTTSGLAWTNPAGGNWSVASNWSLGRVPETTDSVVIALPGTYTVVLDTTFTAAFLDIGGATGTQTLTLTSRTLTVSGAMIVRNSGVFAPNNSTIAGPGAVINQGTLILRTSTIGATSALINQGTVVVSGSSAVTGPLTTAAGSTLRLGETSGSATLTSAGSFTNNGLIELTSTGAAYAATLTVTAGTLTNASGGTITTLVGTGGTRRISAVVDNQGSITVHPGPSSSGILNIVGSLTTSGTLNMELGGLVAGTGYSQVTVTGTATLGGTLNFSLVSFAPTLGNTFDILTSSGTLSGTLALGTQPGGWAAPTYTANAVRLTAP
jgi:hypothetical protein